MKYYYRVIVSPGLDYGCVADAALEVHRGDHVIVRCDRYQDYATVLDCAVEEAVDLAVLEKDRADQGRGRHVEGDHVPEIVRRASAEDEVQAAENARRARTMHLRARERIAAHRLEMKLIDTHCSFDGRLAVFQFSAEGRVDFRELLRDLSHEFHMRVELRQVGVRDEAAIQGGIGPCGRAFCCATFLKRFTSINVKMAKIQGLSLNPVNISGACGRLKCCLEYEVNHYRELFDASRGRGKGGGAAPREDSAVAVSHEETVAGDTDSGCDEPHPHAAAPAERDPDARDSEPKDTGEGRG